MIEMLNQILSRSKEHCLILLENTAGYPGSMGTTMEELVQVLSLCEHPDRIGFCLDTCHASASNLWNGDNLMNFLKKGKSLAISIILKPFTLITLNFRQAPARIDTPIYLTKFLLLRYNLISLSMPNPFENCL